MFFFSGRLCFFLGKNSKVSMQNFSWKFFSHTTQRTILEQKKNSTSERWHREEVWENPSRQCVRCNFFNGIISYEIDTQCYEVFFSRHSLNKSPSEILRFFSCNWWLCHLEHDGNHSTVIVPEIPSGSWGGFCSAPQLYSIHRITWTENCGEKCGILLEVIV